MLNPIFNLLSQFPQTQTNLRNKFNLKVSSKTFAKTHNKYWLLELELPTEKQITLKGIPMNVESHHFTIPSCVDIKTHSVYHYTLCLETKQKQVKEQYKIHLYFDKLDRITVEPSLFIVKNEEDASTYTQLLKNDIDTVSALCAPCTNIILFLKQQLKLTLAGLLYGKNSTEAQLIDLSVDFNTNKAKYIDLARKQINNIQQMEKMGTTVFFAEKIHYKKMISWLEELKSTCSLEESSLEEIPLPLPLPTPTKSSTKTLPPAATIQRDKTQEARIEQGNQLISTSEDLLLTYEKDKKLVTPNHIEKMVTTAVDCNGYLMTSTDCHIATQILKQKSKLAAKVIDFFDTQDLEGYAQCYLYAIKAKLFLPNDKFIKLIIKSDNIALLKQTLDADLIHESTKFRLERGGPLFTMVEWCIHFNSNVCFNELMSQRFSLDYVDEVNSPLLRLLQDPIKYQLFLGGNVSINNATRRRFTNRVISLLEKKHGKEPALLTLKIERINITERIVAFLIKKGNLVYKAILLSNFRKSHCKDLLESKFYDLNKLEEMSKNIELEASEVASLKAFYQLLLVMTPQFKELLRDTYEWTKEELNIILKTGFEAKTEDLIACKIKQNERLREVHKIYHALINSREIHSYDGSTFVPKKNGQLEKVKPYFERLSELQSSDTRQELKQDISNRKSLNPILAEKPVEMEKLMTQFSNILLDLDDVKSENPTTLFKESPPSLIVTRATDDRSSNSNSDESTSLDFKDKNRVC